MGGTDMEGSVCLGKRWQGGGLVTYVGWTSVCT